MESDSAKYVADLERLAREASKMKKKQQQQHEFFMRSSRQRLNFIATYVVAFVPWLLYIVIYCLTSFHAYYTHPDLCIFFVAIIGITVLFLGTHALGVMFRKFMNSEDHEPNWWTFLFLTCGIAWGCGLTFGRLNFWTNMQPYYSYLDLEQYDAVNPTRIQGRQIMDAGLVNWADNTTVDVQRSMGFKNVDTYCVAPLTVTNQDGIKAPLSSYDFWAVGLNCCESNSNDFHCGTDRKQGALQGLRMLRDEDRAFYRLAVQQASTAHQIVATHPLFFYWVEDAHAEMDNFRDMGYRYCLIGMLAHFGWQLLCVVLAMVGFSKKRN